VKFIKNCKCKGLSNPPTFYDKGLAITGTEFIINAESIRPPICQICCTRWKVIEEEYKFLTCTQADKQIFDYWEKH